MPDGSLLLKGGFLNRKKIMEITEFNEEKYYETEIEPLVREIMRKCNYRNIPMFFCACTSGQKGKNHYETELLSPGFLGIKTDDHRFVEYVKVNQGFETVAPRHIEEVELN